MAFLIFLLFSACKVSKYSGDAEPISHEIWDSLLKKHVSDAGLVDYQGFQSDSTTLKAYLTLVSNHHPNDQKWTKNEQLAYWINAYNAFTIQLVADHYPVASIKDIKPGIPFVNTVWDIKFIKIENRTYDLNNIEHGIIRPQFNEPRIHFAVNCASFSCPKLRNEAYTADKLEEQLTEAARDFINDETKNTLSADSAQISSLFKWFKGDFTQHLSLVDFINQYSRTPITENTILTYQTYDWSINDVSHTQGQRIN